MLRIPTSSADVERLADTGPWSHEQIDGALRKNIGALYVLLHEVNEETTTVEQAMILSEWGKELREAIIVQRGNRRAM